MKKEVQITILAILLTVFSICLIALGLRYYLQHEQTQNYLLTTKQSVHGVNVESPVEYKGVKIGVVKQVSLQNDIVHIIIAVNKAAPINSGIAAVITTRGLTNKGFTGFVEVELFQHTVNKQPIKKQPGERYAKIPLLAVKLGSVDTILSGVSTNVESVEKLIAQLLNQQTVQSFQLLIKNLQQLTTLLNDNNQKLTAIINNTQDATSKLSPLLVNGNSTMNNLNRQLIPSLRRSLKNVDTLSTNLLKTLEQVGGNPAVLIRGTVPRKLGPGEQP